MSKEPPSRDHRTPHTEEQIREYTIGDLPPRAGKILIVDYDPIWPEIYRSEAAKIQNALRASALRIEHTGSTSVPGLAAKPVIDMLLVLADSAAEDVYLPPLERIGYTLRIREPNWHEHRMFNAGHAEVNLHVFSSGCSEIGRILGFRDWLRAHADDRDLYARTKLALAGKEWKYVQNYADAKTAVIEEIMVRAGLEPKE